MPPGVHEGELRARAGRRRSNRWASAMTSPSADSPAAFAVRVIVRGDLADDAVGERRRQRPVLRHQRGQVRRAAGRSRVTIRLFTVARRRRLVRRLTLRSMSVTSRPADAAPVTILPSMRQLTAQFVWPVTTTSTSSSIASTIGGSAPDSVAAAVDRRLVQRVARRAALVEQHDDRLHALRLQLRHERVHGLRLVEEVDVRDAGRADDGRRPLERHADHANLETAEVMDRVGREDRLPVGLVLDVRREEVELRAEERSPSWQPSTGWQPPFCIRSSSSTPSSNSWFPTPL